MTYILLSTSMADTEFVNSADRWSISTVNKIQHLFFLHQSVFFKYHDEYSKNKVQSLLWFAYFSSGFWLDAIGQKIGYFQTWNFHTLPIRKCPEVTRMVHEYLNNDIMLYFLFYTKALTSRKCTKQTHCLHINYTRHLKYAGYQLCLLVTKTSSKAKKINVLFPETTQYFLELVQITQT